ncbi:MAG TPA: hypothetical protein VI407_09495 [Erythrobacter sp.]
MFLRSLLVAAMALLVSGCAGWWSETRLIPISARDPAGLVGPFTSGEGRMILSPAAQGLVRVADPAGEEPASDVAFALLREEPPRPSFSEEAEPEAGGPPSVVIPDRSYLMEFEVKGDEGKTAYTYAIARIGFAQDGSADQIETFGLLCSKASERFAARKEQQICIFDDYARLRAAALDALAWQEDARMPLDTTTWQRESEPDEIVPEP